jgi:hypothetical protein
MDTTHKFHNDCLLRLGVCNQGNLHQIQIIIHSYPSFRMSSFVRTTYFLVTHFPLDFGGDFPFAGDNDAERDLKGDLAIA